MRRFHRSARFAFAALVVATLTWPRHAASVQSSASLSLVPSNSGPLVDGQEIDVSIVANNTSTDTPNPALGDGTDPVPATLGGPVTVSFGCQDCACAVNTDGRLVFVPGAVAGCVGAAPGVLGCAAGVGSTVLLEIDPAGVAIPAASSVALASIRLRVDASASPVVTPLVLRGVTEPCAVRACSSNAPATLCSDCDAGGCSLVFFQADVNPPMDCPHPCPARIRFLRDAATPDLFEFHALVDLSGVDPATEPFTVTLSNAAFQPIFAFTLPAGSFTTQGPNFFYRDNRARQSGGFELVKLSRREGAASVYKLDVRAFSAMEALATQAVMTVELELGVKYSTTNAWDRKAFGWQLNKIASP